jgi:predicted dithiol-disulfide oxidoreductase (DUF899 family)
MLLHVFDDNSALIIYAVMSVVLVFGNTACYLCSTRVSLWLHNVSSFCVRSGTGTPGEQQPLMKA